MNRQKARIVRARQRTLTSMNLPAVVAAGENRYEVERWGIKKSLRGSAQSGEIVHPIKLGRQGLIFD